MENFISNSYYVGSISDLEVYLKSKIAEVHHISNDGEASCYSEPNGIQRWSIHQKSNNVKPIYHTIDPHSARRSLTTESKASVYYTPDDLVDQHQLQLSPMHINVIQENLNSFADYLKPSESICKFDFNVHRVEANLEQEIDRRRQRINLHSKDDDDDDDETIEINMEKTRMLNSDDANFDNTTINQGYIRLNTLPKRNKCKRTLSGKDFYYSLENVFDPLVNSNNIYQMHLSNKTIDEASCEETQMSSSASDNCSGYDPNQSNTMNNGDTKSVLVLNEACSSILNEIQTSNSMPNISESKPTSTMTK